MKPSLKKAKSAMTNGQPAALYKQVKTYIEKRIEKGTWPSGHRLPSENELVRKFGVSRMTINRALRELTGEGMVVRLQGVGTFVAERRPQSALLEIRSIAHDIAARGGEHSADVHVLRKEKATLELAEAFSISRGGTLFHSLIVHRDRGRPVQLADRYVNPVLAPDYLKQDFTRITPSQYLFQQAPLTEAEHIIEAMMPDSDIRGSLEIGPLEPCLLVHRRTWSHGLVVTKARFYHPGSWFRLAGRFRPVSSAQPLVG